MDFITRSIKIHGDKYDYSKVVYIKSHDKVIIICKTHGEFLQAPYIHLHGHGCKKCGDDNMKQKQRFNTTDFIKKAIKIHGDKYDYSNVKYINARTKVDIICKIHGLFQQIPDSHFRAGAGCQQCGYATVSLPKTTRKGFIEKSILIYGDIYDYNKVVYVDTTTKVIIICKTHGEFLQTPAGHFRGGCKKCAVEANGLKRRSDTDEFVKKAKQLHGDIYDYSNVIYYNNTTPVIIVCKFHGEYSQQPSNHLMGKRCPQCSGVYSPTTYEFVERAITIHGDTYDYSETQYDKCDIPIKIICKKHGLFEMTPSSHLSGCGCRHCSYETTALRLTRNTPEFIERAITIHGDTYDYSKVEYVMSTEKVIIICKSHGEFLQTPGGHLGGAGCSLCVNKTESKLYNALIAQYPTLTTQFKQDWCMKSRHLPFDFCIPEDKIIIELDGRQHFQQVRNWSTPEEQFENDKYKESCANDNNYSVIRIIQEDVWNDAYDWCKTLRDSIEEIKAGDDIVNIYLCKNGEYENF